MNHTYQRIGLSAILALSLAIGWQGESWANECAPNNKRAECLEVSVLSSEVPVPAVDLKTKSRTPLTTPLVEGLKAPTPHYWRTLLELATVIGGGTAWYWLDRERQVADWDYPSWTDKVLLADDVMIFDNNPFMVNYTWHTYAGGSSHLVGRSNNLGLWESVGMGTLASIFWEYNIESREKISVNDLLITNSTGIPTGEYFHRLGQYVNQGQKGLGWDIARWTLGFGHTLHAELDHLPVSQDLKLTPDFRYYYSLGSVDVNRQDGASATPQSEDKVHHTLGFEGHFVALDGYMSPGLRSGTFAQANFTQFSLNFTRGSGSATRAEANTLLAGYYRNDVPEEGQAGIGNTLTVATSLGYLYHREQFGIWQDRLGGLHIPGLGVTGSVFGDNWALRGEAHANYDLVGVNSLSWQQFRVANPDEIGKSILLNSGYYYGFGPSARLQGELEVSRFTAGGRIFYGAYESIEGFDRKKAQGLPADMEVQGEDTYTDLEVWLRAKVYDKSYAQLRYGRYFRDGSLGEFEADEDMTRVNFELGFQY